jgi:hypothetical protein
MTAIHNRRDRFRQNLDHLDAEGQFDAVLMEVRETFGRFDPPDHGRGIWWELELHGITAQGVTEEAAIAHWKKLADRLAVEDDGEDTPVQVWHALIPAIGEVRPVPVEIAADTMLAELEDAIREGLPEYIRDTAVVLGLFRHLAAPAPGQPAAFRLGDPRLKLGEQDGAGAFASAATLEHG